jgi:hypothetical protein
MEDAPSWQSERLFPLTNRSKGSAVVRNRDINIASGDARYAPFGV